MAPKKSSSKKIKKNIDKEKEYEEIIDKVIEVNSDEDSECEPVKKKNRKGKGTKNNFEEPEDDNLSDLDLDDGKNSSEHSEHSEPTVPEEDVPVESDEYDQVVKPKSNRHTLINPDIPIGQLRVMQILEYLIQLSIRDPNPILKDGIIKTKRRLTGKTKRRNRNHNGQYNSGPIYGSKTNYGSKSNYDNRQENGRNNNNKQNFNRRHDETRMNGSNTNRNYHNY